MTTEDTEKLKDELYKERWDRLKDDIKKLTGLIEAMPREFGAEVGRLEVEVNTIKAYIERGKGVLLLFKGLSIFAAAVEALRLMGVLR